MLRLSWGYRWACVRLMLLQGMLLGLAILSLRLLGFGIDLVRHYADPAVQLPSLAFGFSPPTAWTPLAQIAVIAAMMLAVELVRSLLNHVYTLSLGLLVHRCVVVDLRAQLYAKLQRLSFRFFDTNSTGSILNRVTTDAHGVRAFIDQVLVQLVILLIALSLHFLSDGIREALDPRAAR